MVDKIVGNFMSFYYVVRTMMKFYGFATLCLFIFALGCINPFLVGRVFYA
jgi:hypothetical protein